MARTKIFIPLFALLNILSFSATVAAQSWSENPPFVPWEKETSTAPLTKTPILKPEKLSLSQVEKAITPLTQHQQPTAENNTRTPPSRLEELYASRVIDEPRQFGYNIFKNDPSSIQTSFTLPAGQALDHYILGNGDELNIIVRGQINSRERHRINSQGLLVVDQLPPIMATGRPFKDVVAELESETLSLHNTQIFVSLSAIRQIGVLIIGDVYNPGRKTLTAFHTVLDAIQSAGGIQKTGSLRQIKLIRDGKSQQIDLYNLLLGNQSHKNKSDMLLKEGDRLIIPPIGKTLAISGHVKRPGIYEIPAQTPNLTLNQTLYLAGGLLSTGQNRFIRLEYTSDGEETVQDIQDSKQAIFGDSTVLVVTPSTQKRTKNITLSGHTRQPGDHDLKKKTTLSALLSNDRVMGNNIYPLLGIIERQDPQKLTKELQAFSPYQVLQKTYDAPLKDGDDIHLFSLPQILSLDTQETSPPLSDSLVHKASFNNHSKPSQQEEYITPLIKSFMRERAAFIRGAIRQEGAYPITPNTSLDTLLAASGGLSLEANPENIELTSRENGRKTINLIAQNPAEILVNPGDTIRINQKFHKITEQSVTIMGEVKHPGQYDLMPGDTLLKLVERAGGITSHSYADGAIFSRASERTREKNRFKAQAQDLELKLAASIQQTDNDKKPDMAQLQATQNLIAQLKNATAVGRITVEADPAVLRADETQDILLESGDKIYIPKRPMSVRVAGEVLSPAALQFRSGKDPLDYIEEAGGTTYYADKDRAFVIYPDGSAQPLQVSAWNHKATFIPPGSTIIVPRDPKPFNFIEGAERVSQILANLAISGLYIDAIGDDG